MAREFTDASPPCQCGFVYGRMTRIYETDDSNVRPPLSRGLAPLFQERRLFLFAAAILQAAQNRRHQRFNLVAAEVGVGFL